MEPSYRRGLFWALLSAFFSALFIVPWKLSAGRGPAAVSVLAMLVTAAVFSTLLALFEGPVLASGGRRRVPTVEPLPWRGRMLLALSLAVCTLGGNTLSAWSIATVSASVLSVLQRTEVLWIALLSAWFLGERIEPRFYLGVGLSGAGLVWLSGVYSNATTTTLGVTFGVMCAVAFSAMAVLTRKYITRIDPVPLNALRLWLSVPLWFVVEGPALELHRVDSAQVGYAALAGLFGPVSSRLCLMFSARHVEARITAMVVQTAPLFTVVLAYATLGEVPLAHEWAGGSLMLLGVLVTVVGPPARILDALRRGAGP